MRQVHSDSFVTSWQPSHNVTTLRRMLPKESMCVYGIYLGSLGQAFPCTYFKAQVSTM